jgi:6-phosphogluconolactonase
MNRLLYASVFLSSILSALSVRADEPKAEKMRVYIGTYTSGKSKGIYRADLDLKTGALSEPTLAVETRDPSFLAIHPSHQFLYAVGEGGGKGISAFAIEKDGDLKLLNAESVKGSGPCHISLDKEGKHAFVANYGSGSIACLPIGADGKLGEASSAIQHKGSSVDPGRQKEPHAHSINLDPANKFVFAADLGLDKVLVYRFDPANGKLTPNDPPHATVAPGSGPRHFAFHPSGKYAYVINEMLLTVTGFTYDADKGVLKEIQTISTVPAPKKGGSTAEIVVHPSGKFLYGSNRGHNTIAIFKIDEETGKLTLVGHQGKTIKEPRNFAIEPTGRFLLVGNQNGASVSVFRIDQKSGELELVGEPVSVPNPVCIRFMAVK